MKLSDDDYYRKLRQNTPSEESSDAMGAGTNNSGTNWTASVLRWSTTHCSQIPGSPGVSQGMVWSQQVAGLVCRPVQDTYIVLLAGLVGAGQLGHQEDI